MRGDRPYRAGRRARYDLSRVPDTVSRNAPMPDDPPPILGTWKRLYIFVLCFLAAVIALFYAFTRFFA
jgi:hypothetical protein